MLSLLLLQFLLAYVSTNGVCDLEFSLNQTHTWSKGYLATLCLDQEWLTQYTNHWMLSIHFCSEVDEFKVGQAI